MTKLNNTTSTKLADMVAAYNAAEAIKNGVEKPTIFIIRPSTTTVRGRDLAEDRAAGAEGLVKIEAMIAEGKAAFVTLDNGHRIVCHPNAIIAKGAEPNEKQQQLDQIEGSFTVLTLGMSDEQTMAVLDNQDYITSATMGPVQIIGPALLVGPARSDTDTSVTECTMTPFDVSMRIAFLAGPQNVTVGALKKLLRGLVEKAEADGGFDHSDISEENLIECGCGGCVDELKDRAARAGGSRAVH